MADLFRTSKAIYILFWAVIRKKSRNWSFGRVGLSSYSEETTSDSGS